MNKNHLLTLTKPAKEKAEELLKKENNNALKLRVFVVGGGCSGLRYGFAFDDKIKDDDTFFDHLLLIDCISVGYLKGATIDYQDGHFLVKNPAVRTGCPGCGHH